MTVVIWALLLLIIASLVMSATFLASSVRDFRSIKGEPRRSDVLEHRRHIWQQSFKTAKLSLMGTAVVMFLFQVPPLADARAAIVRWLIIATTFIIAISVLHERRSTTKIVATILAERLRGARELLEAAENYCGVHGCPILDDPNRVVVDTQGKDGTDTGDDES